MTRDEGGTMRERGAALVITAALALTGCTDDTPAPAPPESAAPAGFVDVVRGRLPEVAVDRRDEEIQALGDRACIALNEGTDADAIITETRALGTTDAATARELIKLAIDTTCPDQDRRAADF